MIRAPIKWGNVTVPYTAMWTDELERRKPRIVMERWHGHRIAMLGEGVSIQEGKPVFKMLHADRCREVIRRGLCQMCLKPLPSNVVTVNQCQHDALRPLINDGLPMCPPCAMEALDACPGMQRQQADGTLRMWISPCRAWLLAPVILRVVSEDRGGDERLNRLLRFARQPVFTGPKLVLTSFRRFTLGDFMESAAP